MELTNTLQDHLAAGGQRGAEWDEAVRTLVLLLNPMAPHIAEEIWEELGGSGLVADAAWPEFDAQAAAEPEIELVVQVGGVKRDVITAGAGLAEADALAMALGSEKVQRALGGRQPGKVIYVANRGLINLVP
jgi:leucyl-tRNA synthetase